MAAISGVRRSLTNEVTPVPKAAPTTIPTAMSTTLPRNKNCLNPCINSSFEPALLGGQALTAAAPQLRLHPIGAIPLRSTTAKGELMSDNSPPTHRAYVVDRSGIAPIGCKR